MAANQNWKTDANEKQVGMIMYTIGQYKLLINLL